MSVTLTQLVFAEMQLPIHLKKMGNTSSTIQYLVYKKKNSLIKLIFDLVVNVEEILYMA